LLLAGDTRRKREEGESGLTGAVNAFASAESSELSTAATMLAEKLEKQAALLRAELRAVEEASSAAEIYALDIESGIAVSREG
jgi:hypothetical protein